MKNQTNKFLLHSLIIMETILFCMGFIGFIFGIIRNILQSEAIRNYRYDISTEFKVVTSAIIICSIFILISAGLIGIIIRTNIKTSESEKSNLEPAQKSMIDTPSTNFVDTPSVKTPGWLCPNCNTHNSEYTSICGCGTRKP